MSLRALGIGPEGSLIAANKLAANDKVVLADFVVAGADSSLRGALTTALRTQLEQSSVVQIVPQSSVSAAMQRMRVSNETPVSVQIARDVAQREGAKAVIAADAAPLGGGYLITERLIDAASGDVLASYAETAAKSDDLLQAIDAVSRKLRGRMGESLKAVRAAPALEVVTTSSLEALKKFAAALDIGNVNGDFRQAVQLGEAAVALDSTFALAWRRLSLDYGNARMARSLAQKAMENAYKYRDRLPPVERALVAGLYFGPGPSRHANRAKAVEAYTEALRLDTLTLNAASASNQLSVIEFTRRDFRAAERYARIQIRIAPSLATGYPRLIYSLIAQDRMGEAQRELDSLKARSPNAPGLPGVQATMLTQRRQYDGVPARVMPYFASSNTTMRQNAWSAGGASLLVTGGFRAALAFRDSIDAATGPITREDSADLLLTRTGVRLALEIEPEISVKMLDQLSSAAYLAPIPVGLRRYYDIVQAYARMGQLAKAKGLLARADAAVTDEESRYLYQVPRHRALAEIALAEHRYPDALAEFRAADRLPDGPSNFCAVCLHGDLARVFDAAGQRDSAIAEFTAYHQSVGLISVAYDGFNLAGSYKRLGELYEAKGDVKRAVELYDKFVALWKNADPELQPVVSDVRRRITRLTPVER